jgi:hypothetical protein
MSARGNPGRSPRKIVTTSGTGGGNLKKKTSKKSAV